MARAPKGPGAAFALAAVACLLLGQGIWTLIPGLAQTPWAAPAISAAQAGICGLGVAIIAARGQGFGRGMLRDPALILLLVLAGASTAWAFEPAGALQAALVLLLLVIFAAALALRFEPAMLARLFALVACLSAGAQLVSRLVSGAAVASGGPLVGAELAVALVGCVWAALADRQHRTAWIAAAVAFAAIALATRDLAAGIAGASLAAGAVLIAAIRAGQASGPIGLAWLFAAGVIAASGGLFLAGPALSDWLSQITGPASPSPLQLWVGAGIGPVGGNLEGAFGGGLGLIGIGLALLSVTGAFVRWLGRDRAAMPPAAVALVGLAVPMLAQPASFALNGLGSVLLLGVVLASSLAPQPTPLRRRRPLVMPPPPVRGRPAAQWQVAAGQARDRDPGRLRRPTREPG